MKISAFIRAKSAKNNVTDKATIYFRPRQVRQEQRDRQGNHIFPRP